MDTRFEELKQCNQEHLLTFYQELTDEQKSDLDADIADVNWSNVTAIYKEQVSSQNSGDSNVKSAPKIAEELLDEVPSDCVEGTTLCPQSTLDEYQKTGMTCIGQGKIAALLLAGGQGTRLGVDYPKGMYVIGSPINKSLFQIQAERILKLSELSEVQTGQKSRIIWYIMTSGPTTLKTKQFFEDHKYFGFSKDDVIFFEQNTIPCFDFSGRALLEDKHKLAKAPNGNGGLFEVLHGKGILGHMIANGVEFLHVYCVDNVLTRVCDPIFMGYCISKEVDVGAKVVEKKLPNESVGVICKYDNKFKVIEYSEIPDELAQRRDAATGKLVLRAGSICDHFFAIDFLKSIKDKDLPYHVAIKKIPHIDLDSATLVKPDKPNGIKLEKFIFDVFDFTNKFAVWEVKREEEFSPLKNGPGSEKDNPLTALEALIRMT